MQIRTLFIRSLLVSTMLSIPFQTFAVGAGQNAKAATNVAADPVSKFVVLDKNAQVADIRRLCNNVIATFSSRTEGGKPLSEEEFQKRRMLANFLRALFMRDSIAVRDSLIQEVIDSAKEDAQKNPTANVTASLQTVVFEYFDKFSSTTILNNSDAAQQSYFLDRYVAFNQQSLDDYNKKMAELQKRTDLLTAKIKQQQLEARQQMQEADCRAIHLHDGRKVLIGDHGEYIDAANNQVLKGADAAEADRNNVALSSPVTRNRYRACLAQHGISNLDRTAGTQ